MLPPITTKATAKVKNTVEPLLVLALRLREVRGQRLEWGCRGLWVGRGHHFCCRRYRRRASEPNQRPEDENRGEVGGGGEGG